MDKEEHKPFRILPVPTFGHQPETKTYLGAVALATLDYYNDGTRTSNASLEFTYTWNKQIIVEGDWNYFFREESWLTKGLLHYSDYPDMYFGIGSQESIPISYESQRLISKLHILKQVKKDLFIGPHFRYISFTDIQELVETRTPSLPSGDAGILSMGITLMLERRNNILSPSKGIFLQFDLLQNFDLQQTYSSSAYRKYVLDLRKYWTFNNGLTAAVRSYYQGNGSRNVPFFDLAHMGGDQFTRGFFYGKFRDKNFHTLQFECRRLLFWRIGIAGFGGLSEVFNAFDDYSLSGYRYNLGGGLRILVDKQEQTSLRIDYAIGQDGNSGFYFAFGEAF